MALLAAGAPFLSRVSGLLARPAFSAAAVYGPLLLQAAGQLNAQDETSGNLGGAAGNVIGGLTGSLLLGALSGRAARSAAYRMGDRVNPDLNTLRRAGRVGGLIGGVTGGLAFGSAGAEAGRGVAGFMRGGPLDQQIAATEKMYKSQMGLEEASLPLKRRQQELALEGYAKQLLAEQGARGVEDYRRALFAAALGSPSPSDSGFSTALAQYALGGIS